MNGRQPIPLNRAAGESYDQGQQMTMQEAIAIASRYGHVPSRISSGAIDPNNPNPSGVWGVPTADGWIPVEQLGGSTPPAQSWRGGPSDPRSTSDRARGPYGPNPSVSNPASVSDRARGPYEAPPPAFQGPQATPEQIRGAQSMRGAFNSPDLQSSGSLGAGGLTININTGGTPQQAAPSPSFQRPNTAPQAGFQVPPPPAYPGINTGMRLPPAFGPVPGGTVTYPPANTAPWNLAPWRR